MILVILGIVVVAAFMLVGIYNGLVSKKVEVENAWSQIDVQLKRRHDLIPNLVETVKGYSSYEQETLEKVIQARNSAMAASQAHDVKGQIQAENALTGVLRQFFALSESYPDLKASQNYLQLQEELTSTENRIGFARQHYNDSVGSFNTAIQQVPGNFVAGFGNFTRKEFFELSPEEAKVAKEAPKVSFK